MKPEAASADQHPAKPQPDIVLGVIVAPGLARDVTAKIASSGATRHICSRPGKASFVKNAASAL
jgi:hypothetical protein